MRRWARWGTNAAALGGTPALLRDAFTGADGAALAAHTMDVGGGWTEDAGTWTLAGNRARASGSGNEYATADAGQLAVAASVTLAASGVFNSGLVTRFADAANMVLLSRSGQLYAIRATAPFLRGDTPVTPADGDILAMRWAGHAVTWSVNGTDLGVYTLDADEIAAMGTATRCGLRANSDGAVRFDDFLCLAN